MTAWQGGEMARGRLPPSKRKKEVCPDNCPGSVKKFVSLIKNNSFLVRIRI